MAENDRRVLRAHVRRRGLVADLLDPPQEWTGAFDVVLEILTVQSLPPALHVRSTANIALAQAGLETVHIEDVRDPGVPARWRAEFRRPPA